jgi:hypothetical protein
MVIMKINFYLAFVIYVFIIFSIATTAAQPSQLSRAVNFRHNYIPIEIQNGFVLDSVVDMYLSQSVHFKYNSSGQLIWEDDLGMVVFQSIDSSSHRLITRKYQLFSDNSYNEKGLLFQQSVHYYAGSVLLDLASIIYSYDDNDRIVSINRISNGDTTATYTFQFDSSGNLTGYYWGYWINGPIRVDSLIMKYDSLGRLKSRLDSQASPNEYFYKYDSIGNATCTIVDARDQANPPIDTIQIHLFVYDGSGRELLDIWGTQDTSFYNKLVSTYDGSGKILSKVDSFYYQGSWSWGGNPYIFSYNSDKNLDSCVAGNYAYGGSYFQPDGILLYDHYGNAYYAFFNSSRSRIKPYYSKLSTLGVTKSQGSPRNFYISQNFPNPFNPTTVINYQLPVTSNVTLKVYNVLGKEVKTLVDGRQTAGIHSLEFNGDKLSSGVYFYSITAGAFHQVRKMALVK